MSTQNNKPASLTLTPHACPGDHPQCECGAYVACCSWCVDRSELVAYQALCRECCNSVCENCAAFFEHDERPNALCRECADPLNDVNYVGHPIHY